MTVIRGVVPLNLHPSNLENNSLVHCLLSLSLFPDKSLNFGLVREKSVEGNKCVLCLFSILN